jgi:hypothetical protein
MGTHERTHIHVVCATPRPYIHRHVTRTSGLSCCVCVSALVPCGHLCLCTECVELVVSEESEALNCPMCRSKCTDVMRVYK